MLAEISLLPTTTLTTENMVLIKGGTFVREAITLKQDL